MDLLNAFLQSRLDLVDVSLDALNAGMSNASLDLVELTLNSYNDLLQDIWACGDASVDDLLPPIKLLRGTDEVGYVLINRAWPIFKEVEEAEEVTALPLIIVEGETSETSETRRTAKLFNLADYEHLRNSRVSHGLKS